MTWTKDDIKHILRDPSGTTGGVSHSLAIHRMVLALRLYRPDIFTTKFFDNVETRLRSRGRWSSDRELQAMANALRQHVDTLEEVIRQAKSKNTKEDDDNILEVPKDDVSFSPAQFDDDEDILEV